MHVSLRTNVHDYTLSAHDTQTSQPIPTHALASENEKQISNLSAVRVVLEPATVFDLLRQFRDLNLAVQSYPCPPISVPGTPAIRTFNAECPRDETFLAMKNDSLVYVLAIFDVNCN